MIAIKNCLFAFAFLEGYIDFNLCLFDYFCFFSRHMLFEWHKKYHRYFPWYINLITYVKKNGCSLPSLLIINHQPFNYPLDRWRLNNCESRQRKFTTRKSNKSKHLVEIIFYWFKFDFLLAIKMFILSKIVFLMDFRWLEISILNIVLTWGMRKLNWKWKIEMEKPEKKCLLLCKNMQTKCNEVRNFTTPIAQFCNLNFRILPFASPPSQSQ